jgi:hypothetical protein
MPITTTAYVPNVAPGVYQAVCTGVEDKAAKADPTNIFRVWDFTLADGTGRTVSGSSSVQTTPKSKGGKWLAALFGRPIEVGETLEPVGQRCTIIVALKETTGYEYVETVAPPQGAAPAARTPAAETVAASEAIPEAAGIETSIRDHDALPF